MINFRSNLLFFAGLLETYLTRLIFLGPCGNEVKLTENLLRNIFFMASLNGVMSQLFFKGFAFQGIPVTISFETPVVVTMGKFLTNRRTLKHWVGYRVSILPATQKRNGERIKTI